MDLPADPKLWPDDPLDRRPVSKWRFDRDTGLMLPDWSGYGNHGTITGATWTTTRYGVGLLFDGNNDYAEVLNSVQLSSKLNLTGPFTISAFIYPLALGWDDRILDKGGGHSGENHGWTFENTGSDTTMMNMRYNASAGEFKSNTGMLAVNTWVLVTAVYDGTNLNWYKNNGIAWGSGAWTQPNAGIHPLSMGRKSEAASNYWNGIIADIVICDCIYSPTAIAAWYQICTARASGAKSLWMIPFIIEDVGGVTYSFAVAARAALKETAAVTAAARATLKETVTNTAAYRAMLEMVTSATAAGRAVLKETESAATAYRAALKETASVMAAGLAMLKETASNTAAGRAIIKMTTSVTAAGRAVLKETASATAAAKAYLQDIGLVSATAAVRAALKETASVTAAAKAYLQDIGLVSATAAVRAALKETASVTAAAKAYLQDIGVVQRTVAALAVLKETASQTAAGRAALKMTSTITAATKAYLIDRIIGTAAFRAVVKHTSPVTAAFKAYLSGAVVEVDFTLEPRPTVLQVKQRPTTLEVEPRPDILYVEDR